jgi:heme oxygenase (biliverdin-IX-beta and delta-forming)
MFQPGLATSDDVCVSASRTGARSALREATREVHERLHRQMDFAALVNGTLSRVGYRELLVKLYGFHRPLEEAILSAPRHWWRDLDPAPRRRADRLVHDLAALGFTSADLAGVPLASPPLLDRAEQLLGCLYVREGAILGGKVLARKLDTLLGSGDHGRKFFGGTRQDARLWGEFCATLDRATHPNHLSMMIEAACATFASLESWLDADRPFIQAENSR